MKNRCVLGMFVLATIIIIQTLGVFGLNDWPLSSYDDFNSRHYLGDDFKRNESPAGINISYGDIFSMSAGNDSEHSITKLTPLSYDLNDDSLNELFIIENKSILAYADYQGGGIDSLDFVSYYTFDYQFRAWTTIDYVNRSAYSIIPNGKYIIALESDGDSDRPSSSYGDFVIDVINFDESDNLQLNTFIDGKTGIGWLPDAPYYDFIASGISCGDIFIDVNDSESVCYFLARYNHGLGIMEYNISHNTLVYRKMITELSFEGIGTAGADTKWIINPIWTDSNENGMKDEIIYFPTAGIYNDQTAGSQMYGYPGMVAYNIETNTYQISAPYGTNIDSGLVVDMMKIAPYGMGVGESIFLTASYGGNDQEHLSPYTNPLYIWYYNLSDLNQFESWSEPNDATFYYFPSNAVYGDFCTQPGVFDQDEVCLKIFGQNKNGAMPNATFIQCFDIGSNYSNGYSWTGSSLTGNYSSPWNTIIAGQGDVFTEGNYTQAINPDTGEPFDRIIMGSHILTFPNCNATSGDYDNPAYALDNYLWFDNVESRDLKTFYPILTDINQDNKSDICVTSDDFSYCSLSGLAHIPVTPPNGETYCADFEEGDSCLKYEWNISSEDYDIFDCCSLPSNICDYDYNETPPLAQCVVGTPPSPPPVELRMKGIVIGNMNSNGCTAVGNFNKNTGKDIFVTDESGSTILVYLPSIDGYSYERNLPITDSYLYCRARAIDFDGDGDDDIIISGNNTATGALVVDVYLNNKGEGFVKSYSMPGWQFRIAGNDTGAWDVGDVDGNGYADFVIRAQNTSGQHELAFVRGKSNGIQRHDSFITNVPFDAESDIMFNDFDADGYLDMVYNRSLFRFGNGYSYKGTFNMPTHQVELYDVDADGKAEVFISASNATHSLTSVFRVTSTWFKTPLGSIAHGIRFGGHSVGNNISSGNDMPDIVFVGKDLVAPDESKYAKFFIEYESNTSTIIHTHISGILSGEPNGDVWAFDAEGDGDSDLLIRFPFNEYGDNGTDVPVIVYNNPVINPILLPQNQNEGLGLVDENGTAMKLVDTDNPTEGLLPEIAMGFMEFFSKMGTKTFMLFYLFVAILFLAAIMSLLVSVMKKIMEHR